MLGSRDISVYCQMGDFGCGSGGWTPVMKTDGTKVKDGNGFILLLCLLLKCATAVFLGICVSTLENSGIMEGDVIWRYFARVFRTV